MVNNTTRKNDITNYIKGLLCITPILIVLYYFVYTQRQERLEEINFINNHPSGYVKGIVTQKSSYKGHSITVTWKINGKVYTGSDGYYEGDSIEQGDSILIKYSKEKPQLMITRFNDSFVLK